MTTTLRYRVVAPAGVYIGEAFYAQNTVLSLTANAARYLLLSGIVELNSIQAPTPNEPGGPTEDDIRIVINVGSEQRLVSLTDFIKMAPSFDFNQSKLNAAIERIKGHATPNGDTLGEVEDRIRAVERIIASGGVGSESGGGPRSTRMTAGEIVLSLKVVRSNGISVAHASCLVPEHLNKVIGISLNASQIGREVSVQLDGPISDPSFRFLPGSIWLGQDGALTQSPPQHGFSQKIASALSANTIMVSLEEPIVLG